MTKGNLTNDSGGKGVQFMEADAALYERVKTELPQWAKYMCIESGRRSGLRSAR
jgi:hypothetical protein